jgi:hypothetical protein
MRERGEERIATAIATIARIPASQTEILVLDLSTQGCRIKTDSGSVQVGATIILRLSDRDEAAGQIIWKKADQCGIRFFKHLSEEALDWIATGYA